MIIYKLYVEGCNGVSEVECSVMPRVGEIISMKKDPSSDEDWLRLKIDRVVHTYMKTSIEHPWDYSSRYSRSPKVNIKPEVYTYRI